MRIAGDLTLESCVRGREIASTLWLRTEVYYFRYDFCVTAPPIENRGSMSGQNDFHVDIRFLFNCDTNVRESIPESYQKLLLPSLSPSREGTPISLRSIVIKTNKDQKNVHGFL